MCASPCLSQAQSRQSFQGLLPRIGARARATKHSRVLRLAVSTVSGRHKEVGELGSRAVSQPHMHMDSDLGSRAGLTNASPDPGRAHLPHPPAQPQRLDREAQCAPSLDMPVLVDVWSAHTHWGRNAYVLIDVQSQSACTQVRTLPSCSTSGSSPGPARAMSPEAETGPPSVP